jgi:hypothetical protein
VAAASAASEADSTLSADCLVSVAVPATWPTATVIDVAREGAGGSAVFE